ncbi:hypothetical protein C8J57DRAFT_1309190 [Mycena rebaudengoi]|nr:hypothetical protein C8J57DRAFT_1309190 [Mycena rebaudengoi]
MSSPNATDLLNPLTPLAYLPPDFAYQSQIGNYITIGTLGVRACLDSICSAQFRILTGIHWDILCNTHNDYKLLFKHRIGLGTVAYFFSRLATLFYILMSTLFQTYPLNNCSVAAKANEIACVIALPANSFLFFLRARAIFDRNRYLILMFFCLWLGVLGSALTPALPGVLTAGNVGPTKYCMNIAGKAYGGLFTIPPLINDTIIFLAISWRMFQIAHVDNGLTANMKAFMTGEYLLPFSKAVLQDGQLYYLITVAANLPAAIMTFNTGISVEYRVMFYVCTVMVTNCMACHVYRNTKFGFHKRITTTVELASRASRSIPMFRTPNTTDKQSGLPSGTTINLEDVGDFSTGRRDMDSKI